MMNEMTYTQVGEVLIPDLKLEHPDTKPLGKYGRMRRAFLQENNPTLFSDLILTEQLFPHLSEINQAAQHRFDTMLPRMMAQRGITEELKARDQMRWVQEMNAIRQTVDEIIRNELIYV